MFLYRRKNIDVKEIRCSKIKDGKCVPGIEDKTIEFEGGKFTGKVGDMSINYFNQKEFVYKSLFANKVEVNHKTEYDGVMGIGIRPSKLNDKTFISNFGKSVIYFEKISNTSNSYMILSDKCKLIKEDKYYKINEIKSSRNFFEIIGFFIFENEKNKNYNSITNVAKFVLDSTSNIILLPKSFKKKFIDEIENCTIDINNFLTCKKEAEKSKLYFVMGISQYIIELNRYKLNYSENNGYFTYSIRFGDDDSIAIIGQNFLRNKNYCLDIKNKSIIFEFESNIDWGINILKIVVIAIGCIIALIIIILILVCCLCKKKNKNDVNYIHVIN